MLVHHMTFVSFRLLRKNLSNLREFLGKWFTPPGKKIARAAMFSVHIITGNLGDECRQLYKYKLMGITLAAVSGKTAEERHGMKKAIFVSVLRA